MNLYCENAMSPCVLFTINCLIIYSPQFLYWRQQWNDEARVLPLVLANSLVILGVTTISRTTTSITTFSKPTISITIFSIQPIGIMTISIATFSRLPISITTMSITTMSIMTVSTPTPSITSHRVPLCWVSHFCC